MVSEHRPRVGAGAAADGLIRFDQFWDRSLYDEHAGFYTAGGGSAGRRGSFITSPEVGPLFGRLVAALADREWRRLGSPGEFWFVDAGAGPGGLTRSLVFAEPDCLAALTVLLVERSAIQRSGHQELLTWASARGVSIESVAEMPSGVPAGLVFANELLDNLAARWCRVAGDGPEIAAARGRSAVASTVQECWVDAQNRPVWLPAGDVAVPKGLGPGDSFPLQGAAGAWVDATCQSIERGRLVCVDYGVRSTADYAGRDGWMRTYAHQAVDTDPFAAPGHHDLTADVAFDQLPVPSLLRTQSEALVDWGIDDMVVEARRVVDARAAVGDLGWARARSVLSEAESLVEPTGLGGFLVGEWVIG